MEGRGVNSCTTWTLPEAGDADGDQVNTDVRDAEFVHFAGGDQCLYAAWKNSALKESVGSVVAKGGGSGGGSAGHHINSDVVHDACEGSVTSGEALADPYDPYVTFTTGMFDWPNYSGTLNDSHFAERDRIGRLMAFTARAVEDGLTEDGEAWGVGVDRDGSLFVDERGRATLHGTQAHVVLADHRPERAVAGEPLSCEGFKIWRLRDGSSFDFADRPGCGYYLRGVTDGVPDEDLYEGVPGGCG